MEGCRWVWASAGTFVLTAQLTWHLYSCTRPASVHLYSTGICTPVLDLHLFSCTRLGYAYLCTRLRIVLMYSSGISYICTRSKSRRSFRFVPWGQNFPAWQNKLWSVGLIAHNQIDEYIGAHYSAFIRILAAFYEAVQCALQRAALVCNVVGQHGGQNKYAPHGNSRPSPLSSTTSSKWYLS